MNIHNLSATYFDEPKFDETIIKGIPYTEMQNAMEEISSAAKDLNRMGIKDFRFVKVSLTDPLKEVQRSIFPSRTTGVKTARQVLKLDRNLTYMINFHFEFQGQELDVANVRIPLLQPGNKFQMWGKNYFARSVLVDRGVNLAKNELFIQLDRTSFSMARTTHPVIYNKALTCDTVLTGNPHRGRDNKKGKGDDKIKATQNLFLYLLAKYGWTKSIEMMGTNLTVVKGTSYDAVFEEYYPKGYTVYGSSGIKTSDGGKKLDWAEPDIFILYKGDLGIGTDEYNVVSLIVANFFYVADRITDMLTIDDMEDTNFWSNILGRFIFYRADKPGTWYTDEGNNHLNKSIDSLIDSRTRRRLLSDGIDIEDTYDLFIWLMLNEREVYANVHPSDISRKRVTTIRYLLSYVIDNINSLGYKLLGRTNNQGEFEIAMNHRKLNKLIRDWLKEGTIRGLVKKDHGEVVTLESPSTNMFITNTRALLDQTKVRHPTKEYNHMYNQDNMLSASKVTRCRPDGIDSTPSGATQINPLTLDMSKDTAMDVLPWVQEVEDKLDSDLKGVF